MHIKNVNCKRSDVIRVSFNCLPKKILIIKRELIVIESNKFIYLKNDVYRRVNIKYPINKKNIM